MYFLVYETKALSLEHVNELYESCSSARKSKQYRAQVEIRDTEAVHDVKNIEERKESVSKSEAA